MIESDMVKFKSFLGSLTNDTLGRMINADMFMYDGDLEHAMQEFRDRKKKTGLIFLELTESVPDDGGYTEKRKVIWSDHTIIGISRNRSGMILDDVELDINLDHSYTNYPENGYTYGQIKGVNVAYYWVKESISDNYQTKGDLMKKTFTEDELRNIDPSLPMNCLKYIKEPFFWVMDYNNNALGELVDMRDYREIENAKKKMEMR